MISLASDHRRLGSDCEEDAFTPFPQAIKAGLVNPLRIHLVLVDPRANTANVSWEFNSCSAVGQIVDPCTLAWKPPCKRTCTAKHVVDNRMLDVVRKRLAWVLPFLSDTFRLRTAKCGIKIKNREKRYLPQARLQDHYDADLVVIVTLQPSYMWDEKGNGMIAGYASCRDFDRYHRCTVAHFNWCPDSIDVDAATKPSNIQTDRHTALHEMLHALGGESHRITQDVVRSSNSTHAFVLGRLLLKFHFSLAQIQRAHKHQTSLSAGITINRQFRHPLTGEPLPDDDIYVDEIDPGYPRKLVRKLKTPRVLELARQQFGCPNLTGVALEDSEKVRLDP